MYFRDYNHFFNAFNKRFTQIVCQNNPAKIYSEKNRTGVLVGYFRLFIIATGCPSERPLPLPREDG